ncbi:MAG TPA: hypothetical protein VN829_03210 [Dongiaceae bacterium]|nr:hypothetical protein [Dongiaceae bacterium]
MTDELRAAVDAMFAQEGFYLVTDSTKTPFEAMVVAVPRPGSAYAMKIGEPLKPELFHDAASITGPFMPRFKP